MRYFLQVILLLLPVPAPALLGYKLDLLIHLSLRKGGLLPPQSGMHLKDSFRTNSLVPAFEAVEEQLRSLNNTDNWHVVVMLILSTLVFIVNMLMGWRLRSLEKRVNESNPV